MVLATTMTDRDAYNPALDPIAWYRAQTPVSGSNGGCAVNTTSISIRSSQTRWIVLLAALAALSLGFAWRGAGRMLRMHTEVASSGEFAALRADDETKIVIEIREASGGEVSWGKETALVMGKAEDIHGGAIVHVTGTMSGDRRVRAKQIVILTGYVQVK